MNALYLFSSANANGTLRFAQAWAKNPSRAIKYAGALTAAGTLVGLYNRMYGGTDPKDGRSWWSKQSEATKRRNLAIQHEDGTLTKIPSAPGWGYFLYFGDKMAGQMVGEKSEVGNVIGAAIDQATPVQGGSLGQLVSPWFLDPFVSVSENKDYAGRPISNRDEHDKRPFASLPNEQRASNASKAVARFANEFTGGNDARQGAVDVSPKALDYVMGEAGGGVGAFFQQSVKFGEAILRGEKPMWRDVPIVNRFKADAPRSYSRDFYAIADQIDTEYAAAKGGQDFDESIVGFRRAATRYRTAIQQLRAAGEDEKADTLAGEFIREFDNRKRQ